MMAEDTAALCGGHYARDADKRGSRWGTTKGMAGFHGGQVEVERPRVRGRDGKEIPLPSWEAARDQGLLEQWAMNLMLINVSTRKYRRAVRLPEGDVPAPTGAGLSRSAVSRRFKALTEAKLDEWMSSDLSELDLLVIQIDGLHLKDELLMVGAIGVDLAGEKHPLGVVEGATENAAVVQALLDNLIDRGLDPEICRLFVLDGAKALSKAVRRTFGADIPIQRCQIHKARNIIDRLPKHLHASVRRVLRQAWELKDAQKAERLLRNLARRLEPEAPGVSGSILEGLDEILTVTRLGLPDGLRRSLACTNMIESMNSVIRQVCRNVKRWRDARMALRWTGAAMLEAKKGFRRFKAHKQLPILKAALQAHRAKAPDIDQKAKVA
jgi:transposase-like protein